MINFYFSEDEDKVMFESKPEIKSEVTIDGLCMRLKLSKQHDGFPPVEFDFPLSKDEVIALVNQLSLAIVGGSLLWINGNPQEPRLAEGTWRDRAIDDPML